MSFEQIWNGVFFLVRDALFSVTSPFIFLARQVGLELNAAQVWMLFFTLLFVGYAAQLLYTDFVLARRGRRATGTVIGIDPGDETPGRPLIEFRDQSGRIVVFRSHLGVNETTGTIGARVDIVFDPMHPKWAREVGRTGAKAYHLIFVAVFIVMLACATVMAKYAIY